jgi:hypothetical protein
MRQKVTRYPGKDLTVTVWVGRLDSKPSTRDLLKELMFNLTEVYYFDRKLGKKDYVTGLNDIMEKYGKIC